MTILDKIEVAKEYDTKIGMSAWNFACEMLYICWLLKRNIRVLLLPENLFMKNNVSTEALAFFGKLR